MQTQKYSVNQHPIDTVLSWVRSGEIAIPEIQRPFVWDSSKVRDLMDSLYKGFPIGYIIAWRNPDVKLKDGSLSEGKKVLIDGQQRVTAMQAAILGDYVVNKEYKQVKIKIAFNPIDEKFEVHNPAISKDKVWIPDVSDVFSGQLDQYDLLDSYLEQNPEADKNQVKKAVSGLIKMTMRQIGLIELASDLDIDTVTEIFIRINSQGVVLSQADFAMSKIAANEEYGGNTLRKAIDYFCHLAIAPEFFTFIRDNDHEFTSTEYFRQMQWLRNENEDLYDPSYSDLLRVAFTSKFNRGKLSDLVSLLSGRNFETRTFETEIAEESFRQLGESVLQFMSETHFKRFLMTIKSAGFVSPKMIRSTNALNFAYIVYLKLKDQGYPPADIERYVRKWLVFSILTGRYSGSPESMFDLDIRNIASRSIGDYLKEKEEAELSDAFWNASLIQSLDSSVASSPYFNVFLAAQVRAADKGFLSSDITVGQLLEYRGDIHHIFPKNFLKRNGLTRGKYNQIANYVMMQTEINIQVGDREPTAYLGRLREQCQTGHRQYGNITQLDELHENLRQHAIPESVFDAGMDDYDAFLLERRSLIAKKIKEYYLSL